VVLKFQKNQRLAKSSKKRAKGEKWVMDLDHQTNEKLSDLKPGNSGVVVDIDKENDRKLKILLSMSILPGRQIKVIQTYPSYIFQIGQTQYAVDKEIAKAISVERNKLS
jgi:ferrous iron transport protein A